MADESGDLDERRMTFGEHLEELRKVIVRSIVAVVVIFAVCFTFFRDQLMNLVTVPVKGILPDVKFIVPAPFDEIFAYFKVCLAVSVFFSAPVVFILLWSFISPGLRKNERKYVHRILPLVFVLFVLGVLFNYFILVPGMLKVIAQFGHRPDFVTMYSVKEWVDFILWFSLILGAVFQLPLVMLLLQKIGIANTEELRAYRKYAILGGFILGALITPGDVIFTEIVIGAVIALLYEAGIWLGKIL
ncbi:MAG: twin-arginine translocase subunit TatC [Planctomycetes bacterium]|nr:twin-arginine translocase subunit TatC [Planctomycetota bacterium]MBI3846208.1 twin-arginine translocase subunit TatC [Planctomycetota bacterium]